MSQYLFSVPGEPRPKARARVVKGHAFTPPETVAYERKVRFYAVASKVRPLTGAVVLGLSFYLGNARRVDLDNLAKAVKDALNGAAWADDSQVTELRATKAIDRSNPRVVVWIEAAKTVDTKPKHGTMCAEATKLGAGSAKPD